MANAQFPAEDHPAGPSSEGSSSASAPTSSTKSQTTDSLDAALHSSLRLFAPDEIGTTYTFRPLLKAVGEAAAPPSAEEIERLRHADVRLLRAVRNAWVEPAIAAHDLTAAAATYLALRDRHGSASVCMALADSRRAHGHLSRIQGHVGRSLGACARARADYLHGAELVQAHALLPASAHDAAREKAIRTARLAQRRPAGPPTLGLRDAQLAYVGGDEALPGLPCWTARGRPLS